MTTPPLPPSPILRCRLDYTTAVEKMGSRFYVAYSGTTPSGTTLNTVATDIATYWNNRIAHDHGSDIVLTEVDVIDITTYTGASGTATVSHAGTASPPSAPYQCAINAEFDIARRYRGGKPKMFLPPGPFADLTDESHWSTSFTAQVQTDLGLFFGDIAALTVSGTVLGAHVNLSYYNGFTNITNSSGRTHAAPKYRTTPLVDTVTGYSVKALIGSQRRRRAASTY